jgi:hypothetical protein
MVHLALVFEITEEMQMDLGKIRATSVDSPSAQQAGTPTAKSHRWTSPHNVSKPDHIHAFPGNSCYPLVAKYSS